jgi:uncharacterized FlaG/YvyC family protein
MTATKQSQDVNAFDCKVCRRIYSKELLMMAKKMPETCRVLLQNKFG